VEKEKRRRRKKKTGSSCCLLELGFVLSRARSWITPAHVETLPVTRPKHHKCRRSPIRASIMVAKVSKNGLQIRDAIELSGLQQI
jgi:hypothetical protein